MKKQANKNDVKKKGTIHTQVGPYDIFKIPKKRKGQWRIIEAPNEELKAKQHESLERLQYLLFVSPFAHAFTHNKSIVSMAAGHVKQPFIIATDFNDFFPSIKEENLKKELYAIVRKRCLKFGLKKNVTKDKRVLKDYNEILEEIFKELEVHLYDFGDGKGLRLPQGAPASPFLSNVFLHNFDWNAAEKAAELGIVYTRYADDIVISGDNDKELWKFQKAYLNPYLGRLGLTINKKKTKFMPNYKRQRVCGIIVNEKLNIPRRWRDRLRAELYQQKDNKELRKDTKGRLAFMDMVYKKDWSKILTNIDYFALQKVEDSINLDFI